MSKRKNRRPSARRDDEIISRERRQRGEIKRLDRQIADTAGAIGRPFRVVDVDTLAAMESRGTITAQMRDAGDVFRGEFRRAALDPLRAANLLRAAPGTFSDGPGLRALIARQHIARMIAAVGGLASPGGSALWHIVGLEQTLKDWAIEQGWAGRRISQATASGILIAALGLLEAYLAGRTS